MTPKPHRETVTHAPKAPAKRIPIPFDPISFIGTTIAVVMMVCVLVGLWQVNRVGTQVQQMESYISALKAENTILQAEYRHGYDLQEVRAAAVSMGMIPMGEAEHITISSVVTPAEEAESESWWTELWEDLKALFA